MLAMRTLQQSLCSEECQANRRAPVKGLYINYTVGHDRAYNISGTLVAHWYT